MIRRNPPDPIEVPSGSAIITALGKRALESRKVWVILGLWAIGLFFMTFFPALVTVTPEMNDKFDSMVRDAENINVYGQAADELDLAQREMYNNQVWFWRFREPYRSIVYEKQEVVAEKQKVVDALNAEREAKMREAKAVVGLWSDYGLSEARERFWSAFEAGKVFAKRQTFWQMFYSLLSSREENVVALLLHWIFVTLMNFTLGLLGSLFYFVFSLAQMVYSYNSDPLSATAFYIFALIGGASLVATYLCAIYGFAIGSVYVVGRVAVRQSAIQHERQRQQRLRHEHQM